MKSVKGLLVFTIVAISMFTIVTLSYTVLASNNTSAYVSETKPYLTEEVTGIEYVFKAGILNIHETILTTDIDVHYLYSPNIKYTLSDKDYNYVAFDEATQTDYTIYLTKESLDLHADNHQIAFAKPLKIKE